KRESSNLGLSSMIRITVPSLSWILSALFKRIFRSWASRDCVGFSELKINSWYFLLSFNSCAESIELANSSPRMVNSFIEASLHFQQGRSCIYQKPSQKTSVYFPDTENYLISR